MVYLSCQTFILLWIAATVSLGSGSNDCPRHRGLPDGWTRTENKINDRALYHLDLRNAISGFEPGTVYRFRVATTSRKHKFTDASVVLDPSDRDCGVGSWIIDTDVLYSPSGCPDIVITQDKLPMGRAHFKWQAPQCGCVHIRVRVHANTEYFLEDVHTDNGPLARTICAKPGSVPEAATRPVQPAPQLTVKQLSRSERLKVLCQVTENSDANNFLKQSSFLDRRAISTLTGFEYERLSLAIQQRHEDVANCCDKESMDDVVECFGDVRRRRIDTFCSNQEPSIPFSKTRHTWMKKKQQDCCYHIGEHRYDCFNGSSEDRNIQKDADGRYIVTNMDDLDPANDIDDFPQAADIVHRRVMDGAHISSQSDTAYTNVRHRATNTRHKTHVTDSNQRHSRVGGATHTEHDHASSRLKPGSRLPVTSVTGDSRTASTMAGRQESFMTTDSPEASTMDRHEVEQPEENTAEFPNAHIADNQRTQISAININTRRTLSDGECCMNGIDIGFRLKDESFEKCFHHADNFKSLFKEWHTRCDRNFVICCMRVIDRYRTSTEMPTTSS